MSKKTETKEEPKAAPKKEEPVKVDESKKVVEDKPKAAKVEKPKAEKKDKQEKGAHGLYKVEGDKVTRLRPTCERCGMGYFMADHHDRYTCGRCGFTRYKAH